MGMKILFTMRTADRSPKRNYLWHTMRSLMMQGVPASDVHLVPTDPDIRWMDKELAGMSPMIHPPETRRKGNANGIAQVDLLDQFPADWIVMTEDDLEWCAQPLESMEAWLKAYATPDRLMYRFFTFGQVRQVARHATEAPLKEQRGSQVVALRADDARRFAKWARTNPLNWRPKGAPFQDRPHDGFDKLLGYWALQANPKVTTGLVSRPFFVRHLGVESSLHSHGVRRDDQFGGQAWSYSEANP
jgi:hypothetical protein